MIRIGTRKSRLALIQTEIVKKKILEHFPMEEVEIVPIVTKGDIEIHRSLDSFGGKGVFTEEIERELLNGQIDIAVHSAKDMPMEVLKGLRLGAVLEREDPRDVMVTLSGIRTKDMPAGSVIGTSSLRRELQVKKINPEVNIRQLRGNVPTRLQKLRDGMYDGIILAAAGLKRLGLDGEEGISYEYFDTELFTPAAGQGILALEIREDDLADMMKVLNDQRVEMEFLAERRFLQVIGGSCNAPCGVLCSKAGTGIRIQGMYAEHQELPGYLTLQTEKGNIQSALELSEEVAARLRMKRVFIVGAGPGRMDLLSMKALECVRAADVIVYDHLISPSILNEASAHAELIYVGKKANAHTMEQEKIQELLAELAKTGKQVVRLKGGDPFIFGRGGEELLALKEQHIPFEVVPGISSAYSVPGGAGIPVTHRTIASSFHVITGHENPEKEKSVIDYKILAKEEGTLVFLMGLHHLKEIAEKLVEGGKSVLTPAAVIAGGGTAREKTVVGTLADISEKTHQAGIGTPAVIVVGDVVKLKEKLEYKEVLKLSGQRVLITGTPELSGRLAEKLGKFGAEALVISLIRTYQMDSRENDGLLKGVNRYQWIGFTSSIGVSEFFKALDRLQIDRRVLGNVRFAVVGTATGEKLREYGYAYDFVPSEFHVKALAEEWSTKVKKEEKVLLIRAADGSLELEQKLKEKGIFYDVAAIYETKTDQRRLDELNRIVDDVDYITISSSSNADAFAELIENRDIHAKLVVIGPAAKKRCEENGLPVSLMADEYSCDGIAAAIMGDI